MTALYPGEGGLSMGTVGPTLGTYSPLQFVESFKIYQFNYEKIYMVNKAEITTSINQVKKANSENFHTLTLDVATVA